MSASRMKIAYNITSSNGRQYWNRIGVAFVNNDGSINVKLSAIPVDGTLQLRDYVPRENAALGYTPPPVPDQNEEDYIPW